MGCRERGVRWRWSWSAVGVALLAAAGVIACGGGGDDPAERDDSGSTTAPVESTSTTLSTTQEVEAAFLAFNSMVERLAQDPNPDDPEIPERASGETLAGIVDSQTTLQTTGVRAQYGERQATEVLGVEMIDDVTALVSECTIEDLFEVGPTETKGPFVTTFWTEWTVRKVDGVWFVDSYDRVDERDGEHRCE